MQIRLTKKNEKLLRELQRELKQTCENTSTVFKQPSDTELVNTMFESAAKERLRKKE